MKILEYSMRVRKY